jgi:beta-lactamase class A
MGGVTKASVLIVLLVAVSLGACGKVGVAKITPSGQLSAVNDEPFPVLSAGKIISAAMLLDTADLGQQVTIRAISGGYNPTVKLGRQYSLADLLAYSVVDSDNTAADAITGHLGGPAGVQRWLNEKHVKLRFTATEDEMVKNAEAMTAKPSDLAMFLYRLRTGKIIEIDKARKLIELMHQTRTGNDRIAAAFPGSWIAHKSGTYGYRLVDMGIVKLPDGPHIIVTMSRFATATRLAAAIH